MKKCYIDIVKKWSFVFAYDIAEEDVAEVGEWLSALGCGRREIAHAQRVLLGVNKGLTYSSPDLRMSVVCIGRSGSIEQWWDTLGHELRHLVNTICHYYDVPYSSEDASYLQGYVMRRIIRFVM